MTPLAQLLRACTPEQRDWLAERAGTTTNYLYALAGCHRERTSVGLAIAIEDATRELNATAGTQIVTARELATMCAVAPFETL